MTRGRPGILQAKAVDHSPAPSRGFDEHPMMAAAVSGVGLFNEHRFFEAHEALEVIWLKEQGERKTLLHGLIQIAAAFHHYSRANMRGFDSLMKKGLKKLDGCGESAYTGFGIDRGQFNRELSAWRQFIAAADRSGSPAPPLPHITMKR